MRKQDVKYPLASVIPYGPDDKTVTKLTVSIFLTPDHEDVDVSEVWVATNIVTNEKIAHQINEFLRAHGVKTVMTATVVLGCPHEEGADFPHGQDCPFCPFWKGKQGSGTDDSRWDQLKSVRIERLGFKYRFWMP